MRLSPSFAMSDPSRSCTSLSLRPSIGRLDGAGVTSGLGQSVIACIAVNLQRAAEARQEVCRMFATPPIRVAKNHTRRCRAPKGTLISHDGPEEADFSLAPPGVQHRTARLNCKEFARGL